MKLEAKVRDNELTVYLTGELDHHAVRGAMAAIEEQITRFLPARCELDLAGVTFMDSSGVAVILKTSRRMREIGGYTEVVHVPPQSLRVLSAAGVTRLVPIQSRRHALFPGNPAL
jgi:stage II sporulation protein AA (anti-sigma F factor antagonist)